MLQKTKLAILGCAALIFLTSEPAFGQKSDEMFPIAILGDGDGNVAETLVSSVKTTFSLRREYELTQPEKAFFILRIITKQHLDAGTFYVVVMHGNLDFGETTDRYTPVYLGHQTGLVSSETDALVESDSIVTRTTEKIAEAGRSLSGN